MFNTDAPNSPSAFLDYSAAFSRHLQPAIVTPLVDRLRSDDPDDGPYVGTVEVFRAPSAIVGVYGGWHSDYMGNVPQSIQTVIGAPDPWSADAE